MNELVFTETLEKQTFVPETNFSRNYRPFSFKATPLPLLFLPESLTGIIFEQSRLEIPLPKKPPSKNKPKDIVYLPEADLILSNFANAYTAIQFTIRFVKYIQSPVNKAEKILSDKPHLQTLLFYRDNPGNLSNLEYSLLSEAAQCVEKLKRIQYKYKDKTFTLTDVEAKGFIKKVQDSLNKTLLADFFSKRKTEILSNAGFKELEISAETVIDDPRVRAMLEVLVYAEGTGGEYGRIVFGVVEQAKYFPELIGQRDVTITNFSTHPEIYVRWKVGQPLSSAAGRYQFNVATWKDFGRGDFSLRSQDLAAIRLMIHLGMADDLLQSNFRQVVYKGSRRWASFPKSEAGGSNFPPQKAKSIADLERVYNQFLPK